MSPSVNLSPSSSSSSSSPLETHTFTHFPNLPPELRDKIWDESLPKKQRLVRVFFDDTSQPFKSSAKIPVALHVCKESRVQALRKYKLFFASKSVPAQVYFNFSEDVFHMDVGGGTRKARRARAFKFTNSMSDRQNVRFLAAVPSSVMDLKDTIGLKLLKGYFLSLKMLIGIDHYGSDLVDPVVRLQVMAVPASFAKHPAMYKQMFGVNLNLGIVEDRDEDEGGLELSSYFI
jgi:hypothetical protein